MQRLLRFSSGRYLLMELNQYKRPALNECHKTSTDSMSNPTKEAIFGFLSAYKIVSLRFYFYLYATRYTNNIITESQINNMSLYT